MKLSQDKDVHVQVELGATSATDAEFARGASEAKLMMDVDARKTFLLLLQ